MSRSLKLPTFNRENVARAADGLAVALVVSLPWSTSATGILAGLWLLALVPTLDLSSLRRTLAIPGAGLPLVLVGLGAAGMLWANVSWSDRVDGFSSFVKLMFIPLFLYHFRRCDGGRTILIGFLASCVLLLGVSWTLLAWPGMPWPGTVKSLGVPVKDYLAQSSFFTLCIFIILRLVCDNWRGRRRNFALALVALALIFLANIFYVATSRTSLVEIPVILVVFGYRLSGWKGAIGSIAGFFVLAAAAWPSAAFLQLRVDPFVQEIRLYQSGGGPTSAGERLEFWKKSVEFIRQAPMIGHGTGSIRDEFLRSSAGQTGLAGEVSANPHNQILAVGIQIGLVGIAALLAMWFSHLALFRSESFVAWVGFVVVVQNIVGSLFNSHLFDFTHGWGYVLGVGIAGGIVLKESAATAEVAIE
jgi:O-antigen ligase